MARALDDQQQRELTAFVNGLFDAAGYKTNAQWAAETGFPASNLSDLRNGKVGVDGYNLFKLIRAAAARMKTTPEGLASSLQRDSIDGSPESIDRHLRELSGLVEKALERLEQLGERQDVAPERAVPRKGQKKSAK